VREKDVSCLPSGTLPWIVDDPYLAYAELSAHWRFQAPDELQQAAIASSARLGEGVVIAHGASVGPGALIGDRVRLGPGVHIGAGAVIASGCELRAGVVIEHACEIGPDVLIHANTVIGSDGFGFARNKKGQWVKIHQLGSVHIAAEVEIGSHCSIDRGALDPTLLGRGAKLDNQIQIAHNVQIGEDCAIAGCVGIAGSTALGHRVMVGGGAGILGHLRIADDVVIAAMSLISQSISEAGTYGGVFPQMRQRQADRSAAALKQLPNLRNRVMRLETDIEQYRGSASNE
jgi:UDP-3-O-[3-hydroxymyristoyl] glucosamine N-acyltransferase